MPDGTIAELGGSAPATTNNRMEMAAAIQALATLEPGASKTIVLYTDSTYVIRGITQWIWGWRAKGWVNSEGKEVANRNLWEELSRHLTRLKPTVVEWKYVRGHNGNPGNERCDFIAVSFAKNKPERLYKGPRDAYFVDLSELPEEEQLSGGTGSTGSTGGGSRSGDKSKGSSTGSKTSYGSKGGSGSSSGSGPITYLSYLGGIVTRHKTWPECERHVKGRNAKFKKAKSSQEEREILIGWGLDPSVRIE